MSALCASSRRSKTNRRMRISPSTAGATSRSGSVDCQPVNSSSRRRVRARNGSSSSVATTVRSGHCAAPTKASRPTQAAVSSRIIDGWRTSSAPTNESQHDDAGQGKGMTRAPRRLALQCPPCRGPGRHNRPIESSPLHPFQAGNAHDRPKRPGTRSTQAVSRLRSDSIGLFYGVRPLVGPPQASGRSSHEVLCRTGRVSGRDRDLRGRRERSDREGSRVRRASRRR